MIAISKIEKLDAVKIKTRGFKKSTFVFRLFQIIRKKNRVRKRRVLRGISKLYM